MNRMTNKESIPKFATEAEEAQWWYEQRDRLTEKAEAALARGELKQRRLPRNPIIGGPAGRATMETPNRSDILSLSYVDASMHPVPPEAQVWRYMDLGKLVSMLDHNALYFPTLAALKDELEGAPPRRPLGAPAWDEKAAYDRWCYNRSAVFVNCWHCAEDESALMWAQYGNQGVAVRTTFRLLSGAVNRCPKTYPLSTDRIVVGGMVDYRDPDETSPPGNVWNAVNDALQKRRWYKDEHEVRLIYDLYSNSVPSGSSFQMGATPKQMGVWVSCNLAEAILAIVLAPFSPPFLEDAVKAVCGKFGFDPSIVKRSGIEEGAPTPPCLYSLADIGRTSG